jgi:hypothetical protein
MLDGMLTRRTALYQTELRQALGDGGVDEDLQPVERDSAPQPLVLG